MKIPIYDTGVLSVRKTCFCSAKWEAVSQYGYCLQDGFSSIADAVKWVKVSVRERRKQWKAAGRDMQDCAKFKILTK